MSLQSLSAPRFVRRTGLGPNEYRKNFRQLDREVISAVTSPEADRVTPLMSKIYLRLADAPEKFWEREGVLRFGTEQGGERPVNAWAQLCELAGVASATASKALRWMHEQGIIGYFAGKNGAGIRVFLNRASSSIGVRGGRVAEKFLTFSPASTGEALTSLGEAAFNDSYAGLEILEKDLNPRAPKSGAGKIEVVKKTSPPRQTCSLNLPQSVASEDVLTPSHTSTSIRGGLSVEEIISQVRGELEPSLRSAARQAATREHERTREWLESKGLPKAARVAQRETYNVLRQHGLISALRGRADSQLVGMRYKPAPAEARRLSQEEVRELAETCVAMLKVHGQPIDVTLAGISVEAGGTLLAEEASVVRGLAEELAFGSDKEVRPGL